MAFIFVSIIKNITLRMMNNSKATVQAALICIKMNAVFSHSLTLWYLGVKDVPI